MRAAIVCVCVVSFASVARADQPVTLPGTAPLTAEGDLAAAMVDGIHRFLDAETAASVERRASRWHRDFSSREAYEKSVEPNRARLREIIGAVDPRVDPEDGAWTHLPVSERLDSIEPGRLARQVRWPVLGNGQGLTVEGEGTQIDPEGEIVAEVIVIPDADPKALTDSHARNVIASFVNHGCRVHVVYPVDREDRWSVVGGSKATNQPHREFIYRQAYELGRHIVGYEVQIVLAAVDRIRAAQPQRTVGVVGLGEGGLVALLAAALDPRIDATLVSGYFDSRQNLWQEPIYRNIWSFLDQFGDAELASLVAPRLLAIEAVPLPVVDGPPAPRDGRSGAAPGRLLTPDYSVVEDECSRARGLLQRDFWGQFGLSLGEKYGNHSWILGSRVSTPKQATPMSITGELLLVSPRRARRHFDQLVGYTQWLLSEAEYRRAEYWAAADRSSVDKWEQSTEAYRERFYNDVIGRFDHELLPAAPRTRLVYDEPKYTGYEVMLDVFPEVFAYGILLVPKDIKPDERRPVVVCQHGLEGRPQDCADPKVDSPYYHRFACQLAERGFVTYAPQNPYIGQDRFRSLQRKANPLGKSLFSIIIPQHQQTVRWLGSLPFVDPARIGFYGLSYGGKTAMRVPAVVKEYCLSICSADFNEWIWKNASTRSTYSYMGTGEYEMFEFNLGNTFNYSDMAGLIAPRPFMVERGHHDGVAPDEWVAYEYAKVRKLYSDLKIPERTEIEFFDGPHTIHGVGTFAFLHRHLNWAEPK